MRSNRRSVLHLVGLLCFLLVICSVATLCWPQNCRNFIDSVYGDITIYVATPHFEDLTTLPTFTTEQQTILSGSDEYIKILEIMEGYRCHRSILPMDQNNHLPWIYIYAENGLLIFEYRGGNDFLADGKCYSLYGENNCKNMMDAIYYFLYCKTCEGYPTKGEVCPYVGSSPLSS